MSKKKYKPDPRDVELRIRPDGRVYVVAADEAAFDLAEGLDPNHPVLAKRRKAKKRGRPPDAE